MKKRTALILVVVLLLSSFTIVFASEPDDIRPMRDPLARRVLHRVWDKELAEENRSLLEAIKADRQTILLALQEIKASGIVLDDAIKTQLSDARQQLNTLRDELAATKNKIRDYIKDHHEALKPFDKTVWDDFKQYTLDIQTTRNLLLKDIQRIQTEIIDILP